VTLDGLSFGESLRRHMCSLQQMGSPRLRLFGAKTGTGLQPVAALGSHKKCSCLRAVAAICLSLGGVGLASCAQATTPAEPVQPLHELIESNETVVVGRVVRTIYVGNKSSSDEHGKVFDQPANGRREELILKVSKTLKSPTRPSSTIRVAGLTSKVDRAVLRQKDHVYFLQETFKANGEDVYISSATTMPRSNVEEVAKAVSSQHKQ